MIEAGAIVMTIGEIHYGFVRFETQNSACLPGLLRREISKNRKAVPITGTAFYFAGLNETCSVGNKRIQFWNKSGPIQLTLTERKCP
jgi:hypothetical protein